MRDDAGEQTRPTPETRVTGWRGSNWLAIGEFTVVALIFVADQRHLIPLSKTPFLLALAWISLRLRNTGWRSLGFRLYRNWKTTLALGVLAGTLMETFQLLVTQPLLTRLSGVPPDLSDFRMVTGNIKIGCWCHLKFMRTQIGR